MALPPPAHAEWNVTSVPVGTRQFRMKQVSFPEVLAAHAEGEAEPWWAHVWPVGRALAEWVLAGPDLNGLRVLDLGTGSGIVGIALAMKGARVTLGDISPKSLALAAENAELCGVEVELLEVDWTKPPARTFQAVYAADVAYDTGRVAALAASLVKMVEPDGEVVLADPRRPPYKAFLGAMREAGWEMQTLRAEEELVILRGTRG